MRYVHVHGKNDRHAIERGESIGARARWGRRAFIRRDTGIKSLLRMCEPRLLLLPRFSFPKEKYGVLRFSLEGGRRSRAANVALFGARVK